MDEKWFKQVVVRASFEDFIRLPYHPAYKREYYDGEIVLTPRPRYDHALLDLTRSDEGTVAAHARATIRPLADNDWERCTDAFASAFVRSAPFSTLSEELEEAARDCLQRTRTGRDGPLIHAACFVAERDAELIGALLVTLAPDHDLRRVDAWRWTDPPPEDAIARRLGRPHLTWVFVAEREAGRGVGTNLLRAAALALRALGFGVLGSSFMAGNPSSTLWHWRNGFRLLPHPCSLLADHEERPENDAAPR